MEKKEQSARLTATHAPTYNTLPQVHPDGTGGYTTVFLPATKSDYTPPHRVYSARRLLKPFLVMCAAALLLALIGGLCLVIVRAASRLSVTDEVLVNGGKEVEVSHREDKKILQSGALLKAEQKEHLKAKASQIDGQVRRTNKYSPVKKISVARPASTKIQTPDRKPTPNNPSLIVQDSSPNKASNTVIRDIKYGKVRGYAMPYYDYAE